uniref:(northern house mosquito) hypothetical protein n=1 Tax=Culex pipiens TaxID=7175 RepID=A0A8D8KSK4_CULPI
MPAASSMAGLPGRTVTAPLHSSSLQIEQWAISMPRWSFALPNAIWQGSVLPPSSWQPRNVMVSPFSLVATIFWQTMGTVISAPPKYSIRVRSASQLPVVDAIKLGVHVSGTMPEFFLISVHSSLLVESQL